MDGSEGLRLDSRILPEFDAPTTLVPTPEVTEDDLVAAGVAWSLESGDANVAKAPMPGEIAVTLVVPDCECKVTGETGEATGSGGVAVTEA